jgi:hypothetical protein
MATLNLSRRIRLPPALAEPLQRKQTDTASRQRRDLRARIYARLRELGVTVFDHFQPLRIGIHADIQMLLHGEFRPHQIAGFMRHHCNRIGYLTALARGGARRDLDGSDAGIPSEQDRAYAHKRLTIRMRSISARLNRKT